MEGWRAPGSIGTADGPADGWNKIAGQMEQNFMFPIFDRFPLVL